MRGRRESRPALALGVVGAVVLALAPSGAGAGPRKQAEALRQQQTRLAARSQQALLSLYSLDTRLERARAELASLRARTAAVRRERARVAHETAVARGVLRTSQERLADRLRTLYEHGEPDAITIVLGATSLEDAADRIDELERTAHLNRVAIRESTAARERLSKLAARLSARVAELESLTAQAEATTAALEAARAERVRYLASLRRTQQLNRRQIGRLDAAAQRSAEHTQVLETEQTQVPEAAPEAAPAAAPAPASAGQTLTVTATGYSLSGTTATGLPVGPGIVAVDPTVIPLGTRMTIPGYGEGVAADTGSAVQGATIDLWFSTEAQALTWGRRTVTITLH